MKPCLFNKRPGVNYDCRFPFHEQDFFDAVIDGYRIKCGENYDVTCTSAKDGPHSYFSLHHQHAWDMVKASAIDLRINDTPGYWGDPKIRDFNLKVIALEIINNLEALRAAYGCVLLPWVLILEINKHHFHLQLGEKNLKAKRDYDIAVIKNGKAVIA